MDSSDWLIVSGVTVLVVLVLLALWRRRALSQRVGSFTCAVRDLDGRSERALKGIAHYGVGRLDWWSNASLGFAPARSWLRSELIIEAREFVDDSTDTYLVVCSHLGERLMLEMSVAAYAGLTSWLESGPPASFGHVN